MTGSCGEDVRFAEVSEDSVAEVGEFLQAPCRSFQKGDQAMPRSPGAAIAVSDKADRLPDQCAAAAQAP